MDNGNVLHEHFESIKRFREQCLDSGMSEEEFKNLYLESLQSLETKHETSNNAAVNAAFKTRYKVLLLLSVFLACCAYYHQIIYSFIVCQLQDYIYPVLRLIRKLAIPFLTLFPSLTDLYYETCLIQNPFFTVVDMDCWPCSSVSNVQEISNPVPNTQLNAPFIYETNQRVINFSMLKEIFNKNRDIFYQDVPNIHVDNKHYITPTEMFTSNHVGENKCYVWKFNNMHVARILRQFIPRPKVVPKFGQSTERFIIIDPGQNVFKVPDTECNYSFLLSLSGSRIINLEPSEECKHQCKYLKVELKEQYLLWYNWWYWRPVIQPSHSNDTFIGHIGSYC